MATSQSIEASLTGTAADCTQTVDLLKNVSGAQCSGTQAQKWGIDAYYNAAVGTDYFKVPLTFRQNSDATEGATWEAQFETELSGFWSAFEQFDGASTTRVNNRDTASSIAGASALGAVAAVVALAALF